MSPELKAFCLYLLVVVVIIAAAEAGRAYRKARKRHEQG